MAREKVLARAVVLRSVDYGDRDRILTLLVQGRGKRSTFAKGARASRRFAGALESFRVSQVNFVERGLEKMATLTEACVVEDFPGIERSFDKISLAAFATELIRELFQEGEGGNQVFDALTKHYRKLDRCPDEPDQLETDLDTFVLKILSMAGFAPSLQRCCRCRLKVGPTQSWHFLLSGQGAICSDCIRHEDRSMETNPDLFATMNQMALQYLEGPPQREKLLNIRPLIQAMIRSAVGKDLRSTQFLVMVLT